MLGYAVKALVVVWQVSVLCAGVMLSFKLACSDLLEPSPNVNYQELARCTDDFNGAQCKAVCVEAVSPRLCWRLGVWGPCSTWRLGTGMETRN